MTAPRGGLGSGEDPNYRSLSPGMPTLKYVPSAGVPLRGMLETEATRTTRLTGRC